MTARDTGKCGTDMSHMHSSFVNCEIIKWEEDARKTGDFFSRVRGSEINAKRWNLQLESREEEECLIDQMFFGLETYN